MSLGNPAEASRWLTTTNGRTLKDAQAKIGVPGSTRGRRRKNVKPAKDVPAVTADPARIDDRKKEPMRPRTREIKTHTSRRGAILINRHEASETSIAFSLRCPPLPPESGHSVSAQVPTADMCKLSRIAALAAIASSSASVIFSVKCEAFNFVRTAGTRTMCCLGGI